jgi:hypothetical protein
VRATLLSLSCHPEALFTSRLVAAAVERASVSVRYVPRYVPIPYPGGDVPTDTSGRAFDLELLPDEDQVRFGKPVVGHDLPPFLSIAKVSNRDCPE